MLMTDYRVQEQRSTDMIYLHGQEASLVRQLYCCHFNMWSIWLNFTPGVTRGCTLLYVLVLPHAFIFGTNWLN
jgi:hypothetical protein